MSLRRGVCSAAVVVLAAAGLTCQAATVSEIVGQVSTTSYQNYLDSFFPANTQPLSRYWNDQHDAAQANIEAAFTSLDLTTTTLGFSYGGSTYYDVIGVLPGTVHPNNYYMVGAHFDTVWGAPGADDNASGVAGVLEAARVLSQYPFEDSIVFVAFDREEEGLYGSNALAIGWSTLYPGSSLLGMVSLDMIAYNAGGANTAYILTNTGAINGVSTGLAAALAYGGLTSAGAGATDRSDHAPFHALGYPSALLIEGGWQSNPNYHHPTDTVDYLDTTFAANMTRVVVGYLATEADYAAPEPSTLLLAACALAALFLARRRLRLAPVRLR